LSRFKEIKLRVQLHKSEETESEENGSLGSTYSLFGTGVIEFE